MGKETLIQNIINNYGSYGITREEIESLIDESLKNGLSCDKIYFFLQLAITDTYGLKFFWCTARQMARVLGTSDDEMLEIIKKADRKLVAGEEELDKPFRVPVEVGEKFFMEKENQINGK